MAKTEEQTLWEKKEAFIMADAEYKQLCEKVKSLHKKLYDTRQAGRMALQNINRFLLAEELASKQSYKFEDASEEVNTILDDFTMELKCESILFAQVEQGNVKSQKFWGGLKPSGGGGPMMKKSGLLRSSPCESYHVGNQEELDSQSHDSNVPLHCAWSD